MKTLGFPRSRRLTRQGEFRRLYRTGRKASSEYLSVYTRPAAGQKGKVGIVAGRKVGNAVERNRIRRVLREAVRINQCEILEGTDLVIVVKNRALELPHAQLVEQLLRLLRKSEVS
ncbi:MAG: ribonuclease P protein component [Candidatus Lindowbacteria bacterium]|nr:ribonuclease P protein component [Candidatus Lindowbacteria bacterium]